MMADSLADLVPIAERLSLKLFSRPAIHKRIGCYGGDQYGTQHDPLPFRPKTRDDQDVLHESHEEDSDQGAPNCAATAGETSAPRMRAVMASSSAPGSAVEVAVAILEAYRTPAAPARNPIMVNDRIC